jgi:hypothetical protein
LNFTLQASTEIQSTTFLSPNLAIIQSLNDHPHNYAQIHKHKYNINLHKIKQKQEWEIGNELKDWELGVVVSTFKHSKKLCAPPTFLDSWQ